MDVKDLLFLLSAPLYRRDFHLSLKFHRQREFCNPSTSSQHLSSSYPRNPEPFQFQHQRLRN